MDRLQKIKEWLSEVNSMDSLSDVCHQFYLCLQSTNLRDINPVMFENLTLNICFKIYAMCHDSTLPPFTADLIELLLNQKLITDFPSQEMRMLLDKCSEQNPQQPTSTERIRTGAPVHPYLDHFFNADRNERYIQRNYGQAIIDLNGDFIWADTNSEKFFEMRLKEMKTSNFFEMMIPFSRKYLYKKFGGVEVFGRDKAIFTSVTFSYVIYSRTSMNKFAKKLQEKNHRDPDEIDENVQPEEREMANYYKYLKALSSKATLIPLKFTKAELKDIVGSHRYNIYLTNSLKEVAKDVDPVKKEARVPVFPSPLSEGAEKSADNTIRDRDLIIKKEKDEADDVICKLAVILETRTAKNIPAFPYSQMNQDEKILDFKEKIKRKLI